MDTASSSQVFLKGGNCLKTTFGTLEHPVYKKTQIGNDVWLGNNVMIRAGVTIGTGAVVGMGSIVTKDVPPYAIVAGNPAKIIRYRFDEETIEKLLASKWWEKNGTVIAQLAPFFETPQMLLAKLEELDRE
jgi:tetrahydrodipicolinate N-succinyltransferase